jgi:CubicO group peptidase (beta-lactamase class C family)
MRPQVVVSAGILPLSSLAHAQTLPPDVTRKVDKLFEKWDRPDSTGVYKDGQVVYKRGYGMANLNDDVPITHATGLPRDLNVETVHAASVLLLAQLMSKKCRNTVNA